MKYEQEKSLTFEQYLSLLKRRLECYFTLTEGSEYRGIKFDLTAEFKSRENETLFTKNQVMDFLDTKQLCLIKRVSSVDEVNEILAEIPKIAIEYTGEISRHHKLTTVTVAFVDEAGCSEEEVKAVKHFHFHKSHKLGFCGFTDGCSLLVDLETSKIYGGSGESSTKKIFIPVEKNGRK